MTTTYHAALFTCDDADGARREERTAYFTAADCEGMDPETYATDVLREDTRKGGDVDEVLDDVEDHQARIDDVYDALAYLGELADGMNDGDGIERAEQALAILRTLNPVIRRAMAYIEGMTEHGSTAAEEALLADLRACVVAEPEPAATGRADDETAHYRCEG